MSWEVFGVASRQLAVKVAESGYRPDLILAIARGGLPVGGALGYALGVKNCAAINVEFYTGVGERMEVPVVLPPTPPLVDLAGLTVLVADDVADSGNTLAADRRPCASPCQSATQRRAVPKTVVSGGSGLLLGQH